MKEDTYAKLTEAISIYELNRNIFCADMYKELMKSLKLFIEVYPYIDESSRLKGVVLFFIAHINYKFANYDKAYRLAIKAKELLQVNQSASDCFEDTPEYKEKQDVPSQLTLLIDSLSTTYRAFLKPGRRHLRNEELYFNYNPGAMLDYYRLAGFSVDEINGIMKYYISLFPTDY